MKRRPEVLSGKTLNVKTECGGFYLTLNHHKKDLMEIRMELGKSGHCARGLLHLIAVSLSDRLQKEEEKEIRKFINMHLVKFSCGCPFFHNGKDYLSCIDWVGQTILQEMDEIKDEGSPEEKTEDKEPK